MTRFSCIRFQIARDFVRQDYDPPADARGVQISAINFPMQRDGRDVERRRQRPQIDCFSAFQIQHKKIAPIPRTGAARYKDFT